MGSIKKTIISLCQIHRMTNLQILKKALKNDKFYVNKKEPAISLEKAFAVEGDNKLYIQKQNDGEKSYLDPSGGDYLYIGTNSMFNGWYIGKLETSSKDIWRLLAKVQLENVFTEAFYSKYIQDRLFIQPYFEQKDEEYRTRFCGLTIGKILAELGYQKILSSVWKTKPDKYWIPSFWNLIEAFLSSEDNVDYEIKELFSQLMDNYSSLRENYFLLLYEDLLDAIDEIEDKLSKDLNEKTFSLLLLFKSFYLERLVMGLGIFHPHMHYDNVTVELVEADTRYEDIRNMDLSTDIEYDYREYLKAPEKYKIVLRMIDIQGMNFINDWEYPSEQDIFIDKSKWAI